MVLGAEFINFYTDYNFIFFAIGYNYFAIVPDALQPPVLLSITIGDSTMTEKPSNIPKAFEI